MNLTPKGNKQKHIVNIDSLLSVSHNSCCDFEFDLPFVIVRAEKIELVSGHIPETSEPFLFLDIDPLSDKKVVGGPNNNDYFAILRYVLPASAEQNLLDVKRKMSRCRGVFGKLSKLRIRIYDRFGSLHSFGLSKLVATSVDNTNPANVHTSQNHGLTTGDKIFIRNFQNASTEALNAHINRTRFIITTTGVNQFTLNGFDLSGEAVNQGLPSEVAYALGSHIFITTQIGVSYGVSLITQDGSGYPVLHLVGVFPILPSPIMVTILGFDNGALNSDNNLINGQHTIRSTDFNAPRTQLTLSNRTLSSYVSPSKKNRLKTRFYTWKRCRNLCC